MTLREDSPVVTVAKEDSAKDEVIAWFRGEFAAANAIIDSLCFHVTQLGEVAEYEEVFMAVHRRRMNWIPILQGQKYYSVDEVAVELHRVTESIKKDSGEVADQGSGKNVSDDSPESEINDTGSHEGVHTTSEEGVDLCSNHEECDTRLDQIKVTKGFTAKEQVKGQVVNVVRGLKMYDDVFTDCELSKLNDYMNEIRVAGHKGELSGETFILYNQQMKGKKRELIQFGAPIFEHTKEEATEHEKGFIEPIPSLLQGVIDHLVQWQLISQSRKPNSCIINFFDEGEFSQPFLKPPHLEQPICTLVLSESVMAFGRTLVCDNDGNYKGPIKLSLKKGSVLIMRGNSSDMARHAMCPSPNKRVSITFFRVPQEINHRTSSPPTLLNGPMTIPSYIIPNGDLNSGHVINLCSKWGLVQTPVIMLAQAQPVILSPIKNSQGGTGVFLPWTVGQRKPLRRLPPRAQKMQVLSLSSAYEMKAEKSTINPDINLEVKMV